MKVEEPSCGPSRLSIMIGSVLTGPGASIHPAVCGVKAGPLSPSDHAGL